MSTALLNICNQIWRNEKWPDNWTKFLVITLSKKDYLKICNNHCTLSLISHPSRVLLREIINCLKHKAKEITAEEQAGFMKGRSTVEQIFNLKSIIEKCQEHQQELYHVFIDFKTTLVWHQALWTTMYKYNINKKLIALIDELYSNATSSVCLDSVFGEWFCTKVGVRQGYLLLPTLFKIFSEHIITDALEDHQLTISIGGRVVSNLHFANDIDGLTGLQDELKELIKGLDSSCSDYSTEISTEKNKGNDQFLF